MPISDDEFEHLSSSEATSSTMSKAELRKTHKPIMEKRRRARINHSLNEIKSLILEALKKDPARHSKLEKADILEMAVKHLQNIQRQQLAIAMASDPVVLQKFKAGFNECTDEVNTYINQLEGVEPGMKQRIKAHLQKCMSGVEQIAQFGNMAGLNVPFLNTNAFFPSQRGVDPQLGDQNNNPSIQIPPGLQLIPSRLPSGEFAFLVPNSTNLPLHFQNMGNNNLQSEPGSSQRPSAFVTVIPSSISQATSESLSRAARLLSPPLSPEISNPSHEDDALYSNPEAPERTPSPHGFRPVNPTIQKSLRSAFMSTALNKPQLLRGGPISSTGFSSALSSLANARTQMLERVDTDNKPQIFQNAFHEARSQEEPDKSPAFDNMLVVHEARQQKPENRQLHENRHQLEENRHQMLDSRHQISERQYQENESRHHSQEIRLHIEDNRLQEKDYTISAQETQNLILDKQPEVKSMKFPIHTYPEKDRKFLASPSKKVAEPLCIITNQSERFKQAQTVQDSANYEENLPHGVKRKFRELSTSQANQSHQPNLTQSNLIHPHQGLLSVVYQDAHRSKFAKTSKDSYPSISKGHESAFSAVGQSKIIVRNPQSLQGTIPPSSSSQSLGLQAYRQDSERLFVRNIVDLTESEPEDKAYKVLLCEDKPYIDKCKDRIPHDEQVSSSSSSLGSGVSGEAHEGDSNNDMWRPW